MQAHAKVMPSRELNPGRGIDEAETAPLASGGYDEECRIGETDHRKGMDSDLHDKPSYLSHGNSRQRLAP